MRLTTHPAPVWIALIGVGGCLGGILALVFAWRRRAMTAGLFPLKLKESRGLMTLLGGAGALYLFIALTFHWPGAQTLFIPAFSVFVLVCAGVVALKTVFTSYTARRT